MIVIFLHEGIVAFDEKFNKPVFINISDEFLDVVIHDWWQDNPLIFVDFQEKSSF
jgi:hypothetical protein